MISKYVDFKGNIYWDDSKPDGTPKKLMDSSELLKKGWTSTVDLEKGIKLTYEWFLNNKGSLKELSYNQN